MKIYFSASPRPQAQQALKDLSQRYGHVDTAEEADVIVSLGGDGQTLRALQLAIRSHKPVFGLNFGHAGFLQNNDDPGLDLPERIARAESLRLSPLQVEAHFTDGSVRTAFAINEVHVCNHNRAEGIFLQVYIDGIERVPRLGADGLIIATSIGGTGYNKSARGTVPPLGDDLLAFTPNNAFEPDRMRAAIIRARPITINVLNPDFRQADLYADTELIGEKCASLSIKVDFTHAYRLLFDPGFGLHERVMRTQFSTPARGDYHARHIPGG